jgi:predicted nucleic acid-binding protein
MILAAPQDLFLRSGDALHLMTAREIGEAEVWTNDAHMLKAAAYFGLTGRSV